MKNIKIPKRVGNDIVRFAYLDLIETSMKKIMFRGTNHLDLEGYENDSQRVHFTYGGKRCMLQGVWLPNLDVDKPSKLSLSVFVFERISKDAWSWNQLWDVTIDLRDMRFKTLDASPTRCMTTAKAKTTPITRTLAGSASPGGWTTTGSLCPNPIPFGGFGAARLAPPRR